jgi:hypothetical protein
MNAQALQLLISVAGIALMVGLCRVLFGRGGAMRTTSEAITQSLTRDVPGFRAGRMALSGDAYSALIENLEDGHIYLAVRRGDDLVMRKLARGLGVVRDGAHLRLALNDFTLPSADLDLADAAGWEIRLKGLAA